MKAIGLEFIQEFTLALDALMGDSMEQQSALVAECRCGVGGGNPAVLHLSAVGIEVRVLARTFEHHKFTALLVNVEAAFCVCKYFKRFFKL